MPNRFSYNLIGFFISILIYIAVLAALSFYLHDRISKNINYTSKKKSFLNITLVEKKNNKITKKKSVKKKLKKKPEKSKVTKKPKVKRSTKQKATKKVSLQGLFDKIDVKKISEPKRETAKRSRKKVVLKKEKEIQKRVNNASKIVDSLNLENSKMIVSSKDGIYDEFRGKITEILDKNWQNTINTVSGNKAKVIIYIDNMGNFSYKIVTLSYNDAFNAKLMDFLESMKDEEFPPFEEGKLFKMQVEFKDILE